MHVLAERFIFLGFLKEGAKTYLIAPPCRFFTRHLVFCVHIYSPWGNTRYGDCVLATATRHIRPFYAWVHAQLATLVRHGQLARASLEYRHFSSLTTHTGRRRHTATVTGQWARARREKCGVSANVSRYTIPFRYGNYEVQAVFGLRSRQEAGVFNGRGPTRVNPFAIDFVRWKMKRYVKKKRKKKKL